MVWFQPCDVFSDIISVEIPQLDHTKPCGIRDLFLSWPFVNSVSLRACYAQRYTSIKTFLHFLQKINLVNYKPLRREWYAVRKTKGFMEAYSCSFCLFLRRYLIFPGLSDKVGFLFLLFIFCTVFTGKNFLPFLRNQCKVKRWGC